jgi:dihydroxyacetone kinase
MNRDTLAAVDEGSETSVGSNRDGTAGEALIHRLAKVEQAYGELLQRVRQYERERVEMKHRLEGIMAQLDAATPSDVPAPNASSE